MVYTLEGRHDTVELRGDGLRGVPIQLQAFSDFQIAYCQSDQGFSLSLEEYLHHTFHHGTPSFYEIPKAVQLYDRLRYVLLWYDVEGEIH